MLLNHVRETFSLHLQVRDPIDAEISVGVQSTATPTTRAASAVIHAMPGPMIASLKS